MRIPQAPDFLDRCVGFWRQARVARQRDSRLGPNGTHSVMQFFKVRSPSEVRAILAGVPPAIGEESLPVGAAAGRVLARDALAAVDLPEFPRAVVDGFAVRAADTFGASPG